MGFLLPILLAVASLLLHETGDAAGPDYPWALILLGLVPILAARLRRRLSLAGSFGTARRLARLERYLPAVLQALAIEPLGWMRSLEGWFEVELSLLMWPRPELLLALLPFVLYSGISIEVEARGDGPSGLRRELRAFQGRLFAAGMAPIALYLALAGALGRWDLLRIGVEEVSLWSLAFTVSLATVFVFALPFFLQRIWATEPLGPSPELELLQRVADLARFRCRELLVWRTGGLVSNAAIVGLVPSTRRVFITDGLLSQMGPRQLAAVFAHEIGHAKRHHVALLLVSALAWLALVDGLLVALALEQPALELAFFGAGLVSWLLVFGWISRRVELEADLYCLRLLRDGIGITSALQAVGPTGHDRAGWRHFSTRRRIEFLARAAADPGVGRRLRRRLLTVGGASLAVLLAVGTWRLAGFVQDYPLERARVDLRLGRLGEAAERLAAWEGPDPDGELRSLRTWLEEALASGWAPAPSRAEARQRCAARARAALEAGELEEALGWLTLAALTGDRPAGRAARVLEGRLEDPPRLGEAEGDLGPWAGPLQAVPSSAGASH